MMHGSEQYSLAGSILRTLAYYDLFAYPLTSSEVFRFLPTNGIVHDDVSNELKLMVEHAVIFQIGDFFSLQNDFALAARRKLGNEIASRAMHRAKKRARLISAFPFVRSVMISGSLSKGFMDEKSDIDFFIVTEPGRLWISRTLLVLFKRIFLMNSHKNFCVNYFIDFNHLEIEEKNIFTATELATLIPMTNPALYKKIMSANKWLLNFFPNFVERAVDESGKLNRLSVQLLVEGVINLFFAKRIEFMFKNATLHHWQKKYGDNYSPDDFKIAFKSNDHTSKGHPSNFQKVVIERYKQKLDSVAAILELTPRS